MELKDRIKNIVNFFEKIKKEDPRCGDVSCGTCGGYGSAIKSSMDDYMYNEVSEILDCSNDMDIDDIKMLSEWDEFLSTLYGYKCMELISSRMRYHKGKAIDLNNVREMDYFLFRNRWARNLRQGINEPENFSYLYDSMLTAGMELAIKRQDRSLAETIFIILDKSILQYPEFIEKVLVICPDRIVKNYFKLLTADEVEIK